MQLSPQQRLGTPEATRGGRAAGSHPAAPPAAALGYVIAESEPTLTDRWGASRRARIVWQHLHTEISMRPFIRVATRFVAALTLSATPTLLHGQAPTGSRTPAPVRLGLGGGFTMPVGDIADLTYGGVNLAASLTYDPVRLPVGFDVEGTYHNFAPKDKAQRNSHVMSVTGGIRIPITGTLGEPYLMAGVGYYNTQGPATGATDAERDLGGYGGVGIRFRTSRMQVHLRAGFHEIIAENDGTGRSRSRELIPITFSSVLYAPSASGFLGKRAAPSHGLGAASWFIRVPAQQNRWCASRRQRRTRAPEGIMGSRRGSPESHDVRRPSSHSARSAT